MSFPLRPTLLFLGLVLATSFARAAQPLPPPPAPALTLGPLPDASLPERPPLTPELTRHITDLIDGLTTLDKPDFGLSSTLSGSAFAPLPGQEEVGALLLTDHQLETSGALKSLVALGPDALPALLAALDDPRPTGIVVKHEEMFGGMWHAAEQPMNPVNPLEQRFYVPHRWDKFPFDDATRNSVSSYTVKVGDACFVALGQIVGRQYLAIRYQPTACVILNCPAHDPKLCAQVRAVWRSDDPRKTLFDSLRSDSATRGSIHGNQLDEGWGLGSELQCGAALRLLYYFPSAGAPLAVERLDKLDARKDEPSGALRQYAANGLRTEEFIKAVAWSGEPAVRAALVRLFERTDDADLALAALPAVADPEVVRQRLEALLSAVSTDEDGSYGDTYGLLVALARRAPEAARAAAERLLHKARPPRCASVCFALQEVAVGWDKEVLGPLLADRRPLRETYPLVPEQDQPRRPVRVCDEAALALCKHHPEWRFVQAGEHASLDRQIARLRQQLRGK